MILFLYGGVLWGVLPGQPGISWQGHLFGAIGGAIAALLLTERRQPFEPPQPSAFLRPNRALCGKNARLGAQERTVGGGMAARHQVGIGTGRSFPSWPLGR